MAAQITTLIDKVDSFEIVRDQIAAILLLESENQQKLAEDVGKDSASWKLRVFTECSNPWAEFPQATSEPTTQDDRSPIVNVAFSGTTYDESSSNVVKQQTTIGIYNIDCLGYGVSSSNGSGQVLGDQEAAFESQRAVRLCRNILMASMYVALELKGLVGQRWVQSIDAFQPAVDDRPVERVVGARLALRVRFNEFSPQYAAPIIELLSVQVKRAPSGELFFQADFPV